MAAGPIPRAFAWAYDGQTLPYPHDPETARALLRAAGVDVVVVEDTPEPHTPDSIFPNNWISMHADGRVVLYPMEAQNRRTERRHS